MTGQSDCGDGLRVVPQQDRAREVIAEILTATGVLLTEVGFDALTTKEVAARAVINIATLYRYFPNKVALVRELEMQYEAECSERFATLMEDFATIEDWRAAVRRITRAKVEIRTAQPGMEGIRRAFPGSHEFRGL